MRDQYMPFKKGDFIQIDYTARVVETKKAFDTTIESVAKEEGLHKEGSLYEPILIVIGEGWVLKALDEGLENLNLKKKREIEISSENAFGKRDPGKVKLYPLRKLTSKGITPQIGTRIEVDGAFAIVRTIGSGRVLLDFNPPLAGKSLIYEVIVQKKLRTINKKITALIHRRLPQIDITKFGIVIEKSQIIISIPEEAFYIEGLQIAKRGIFLEIQKFFPKKVKIIFKEVFKKTEHAEEKQDSDESHEDTQSTD
jgi:peptidylprolyl isomerase